MKGINWCHGHIDEDTLTAHVFRTFYYVPKAFQLFWKELASKNHHINLITDTGSLGIREIKAWPSWSITIEHQVPLKKLSGLEKVAHKMPEENRRKLSIEPDIVIETTNGCILIVEAELSKDFEASQLLEQFMTGQKMYAQEGKRTFHLLLNKTLCRPGALDNAIKELCRSDIFKKINIEAPAPEEISSHLLWFNWQSIIAILWECLKLEISPLVKKIIQDTIMTMQKAENGGLNPVAPPTDKLEEIIYQGDELISSTKYLQNLLRLNTKFISAHTGNYKILVNFLGKILRVTST